MSARMLEQAEPVRVMGIVGSLRGRSINRWLMEAARELAPEWLEIEIFDLADVPLYNGDLDNDEARPESVRRLKDAIGSASAILIATPEYNHSVPGVLQNAIDWASRPGGKSPLANKPVAIMGASPGAIGTARAQQTLKLVLYSTLAQVFPHPGVLVGGSNAKFDEQGQLTDEATRDFVAKFVRDFGYWTLRVGDVPERRRTAG